MIATTSAKNPWNFSDILISIDSINPRLLFKRLALILQSLSLNDFQLCKGEESLRQGKILFCFKRH